jgi:hypothetical protein
MIAIMQYINSAYAHSYNRRYGKVGAVFSGRYKASFIQDDRYLLEVIRYIHRNPLVAGIVTDLSAYHWSSASNYEVHAPSQQPPWLDTSPQTLLRGSWHKFHRQLSVLEKRQEPRPPTALAPKLKIPDNSQIFGSRHIPSRDELEQRKKEIDSWLYEQKINSPHQTWLRIWAYRRFLGWPLHAIAKEFQYSSAMSVSRVIRKVKAQSELSELREALMQRLNEGSGYVRLKTDPSGVGAGVDFDEALFGDA